MGQHDAKAVKASRKALTEMLKGRALTSKMKETKMPNFLGGLLWGAVLALIIVQISYGIK